MKRARATVNRAVARWFQGATQMMKRLALGAARGTSGAVALRQVCRAGSCPWQCCSPCALRQRSPPATRKLSPVIQAEASEARNAAHGDARPSCRTMLCTTCSAASRLLAGLTTTDARAPPAPWRSLHRSFEGAGHDGAAPFELLHELSPVSSIGIFWLCAAPCLWLQPSAQMPGRAALGSGACSLVARPHRQPPRGSRSRGFISDLSRRRCDLP